jgi:nucleoside-diphosphate-sugar epimerase
MKAFVSGGSGFVGRNLIPFLKRKKNTVVALVRSEAAADVVKELGATSVHGDLDDVDAMTKGMKGCDVVYHSAAHVALWGPKDEFLRANVTGTENILTAARAAGVDTFIHVGTEAVLVGGKPIVNADETWPIPPNQTDLYPLTKGLAEEAVLSANSKKFRAISVRPRFIWGKGDTSVLTQFVKAVNAGKFSWFSGGRYLTSTCHVTNVCEGLWLAAENGTGGETYFVTDGKPQEFRTFVTRMLRSQNVEPPGTSIPLPIANGIAAVCETVWIKMNLKSQPPLTRCMLRLMGEEVTVNDAKARNELNYVGRVSVDDGLHDMRSV